MPLLGKVVKTGAKAIRNSLKRGEERELSRASKKLSGMVHKRPEWEMEKQIKDVVKDSGNMRSVRFTDGTEMPMTTEEIFKMTTVNEAEKGRQQFYKSAMDSGADMQQTYLEKGLDNLQKYLNAYEDGRLNPFWTKKMIRDKNKEYQTMLSATGAEVDPYVLVDYEGYLIPLNGKEASALVESRTVKYHRWQGSASGQIKKAD